MRLEGKEAEESVALHPLVPWVPLMGGEAEQRFQLMSPARRN